MKARVYFLVGYEVDAPDELTAHVNGLTKELGVSYVDADASPEAILGHVALIMGLRGIDHAEIMYPDMSERIKIRALEAEEREFEWVEKPKP